MKHQILFSFLLSMMLLSITTSCDKEEAEQTTEKNDNQNGQRDAKGDDNQKGQDGSQQGGEAPAGGDGNQDVLTPPIVVTVDADGNADGEHNFSKIDENNFYIDDIKYTVFQDFLIVKGYKMGSFKGEAKIISQLNYAGREMQVKQIGHYAFYGSGLTSVTIPSSVTNIDYDAFSHCTGLTDVIISEGVTSIGERAFSQCASLTSVTIPSSVTSIGERPFGGCSSLASITVADGNPTYDSRDNCNAIIRTRSNFLIAGCKNTTIPSSVTSIGASVFSGTGLTSVTIPSSVSIISDGVFYGCTELSSITVEEGNRVFDSRENCNAIIYTHSNTLAAGCKNTTIPSSVTSIRGHAFSGCTGLTSVTIPSSVTSIGEKAFYGCEGLTSIIIPSSVTSIEKYAFDSCTGLTSLSISEGVTSIGKCAFSGCTGLTDVFCYAETLPSTGSYVFTNLANATLHVPASAINAYKTTAPWSDFGSIVAIE